MDLSFAPSPSAMQVVPIGGGLGAELLDAIWSVIDTPAIAHRHRWQAGDLVLWDNRCTMHRRDAFDPASRRVMHRTQVKGAAPPATA